MLRKIAGLGVDDYTYPVQPDGLTSGVAGIAVGGDTSCAVLAGGGLRCWGMNSCGQVGDGTTFHAFTPMDVVGLSSGVKLAPVTVIDQK